MDKSKDPKNPDFKKEEREAVTFGEALVDSVYVNAPEHVELEVGTGVCVCGDVDGRDRVCVVYVAVCP